MVSSLSVEAQLPSVRRRQGGAAVIVKHVLEIEAPATVVWEVITDLPSYPAWNPFVVECRSTLAVGAAISMRVRVLPFWAQPQREWITTHDPGSRLCYGLRGMPLGSLVSSRCHEVRSSGPRSTLYESRFELGGWLAPVVEGLLGRRLATGFLAMSEAIRHRAEELQSGRAS
jgi:hypothetical protein